MMHFLRESPVALAAAVMLAGTVLLYLGVFCTIQLWGTHARDAAHPYPLEFRGADAYFVAPVLYYAFTWAEPAGMIFLAMLFCARLRYQAQNPYERPW